MDIFGRIFSSFQRFSGEGTYLILFLCALFFVYLHEKRKSVKLTFVEYSIGIGLLMIFPLTALVIMDYLIGEEVYWRMFWLLPIPFVMAYAAVRLLEREKNGKKVFLAFFLCAVVMLSGKLVYANGEIERSSNLEKIPSESIEVCNALSRDAIQNGLKKKRVVVPSELLPYVRQYDATIEMPYGRNAIKQEKLSENCDNIYGIMCKKKAEDMDLLHLTGLLKTEDCNYLVMKLDVAVDVGTELEQYGYVQTAATENYVIYRCDDTSQHCYKITQHPNEKNSMFYTIKCDMGGLIVVDGGWADNAEETREVIRENGNKVDAWFITHPHKDHAGAFCEIYKEPQGMEIDMVYAVNMADETLCEENAPWDTFETLEAFKALTIPQLQYVHKGDKLSVDGLDIDILNAYDDYVDEISNDLLNDGSMMFKVTGSTQSMLFCGDVGVSMSDYLLSEYGNTLKSNYLQMGHHGNGGLKDDFYRTVAPSVAFFDAPESLMNPVIPDKYTTPENRKLMEKLGADIRYFAMGETSVVLK